MENPEEIFRKGLLHVSEDESEGEFQSQEALTKHTRNVDHALTLSLQIIEGYLSKDDDKTHDMSR